MSAALEQLEGTVLDGRYRLIRKIGEGGMATVWEAEHMTLGSAVAVKFLRFGALQSQQARERFLREARVSASVRHRNVVEIQDFGVTEDGNPYLVMELLRGETLAAMLSRQGILPVAEAARMVSLILRGLIAVHEQGIIHRDLKPQNVFIVDDPDGSYPKLLDFGVCRAADPEPTARNLTREGTILGTLEYMSPEQARGLRDVDTRTDVYAAGAILYDALTGRLPYEAKATGDLLVKIACEVPTSIAAYRPDLPEPVVEVVMKSIAKLREDRYQSAREMREALFVASRAGGFANVESGVITRIDVADQLARGTADTVALDASEAPAPRKPSSFSSLGLFTLFLAVAAAAWWFLQL